MNERIDTAPFIRMPEPQPAATYDKPADAVAALQALYTRNTGFLRQALADLSANPRIEGRYRACYPQVSIQTSRYDRVDSRLAYGHVTSPGLYATTITRPDLFKHYLTKQLQLLAANHGVSFTVSESDLPIPIHFAVGSDTHVEADFAERIGRPLRDIFDVPDLSLMNDDIVNGELDVEAETVRPLAPFTAPRTDYSLARLQHYTATRADEFQNFVLFTNYQFYIDEFVGLARGLMASGGGGYTHFVEPGNRITRAGESEPSEGTAPPRLPQMPAYHLAKAGSSGITMVNIGVGPSNAKTITDHVAVLRPDAWIMLGHCAGLRNTQRLGDYVLAHAYVREDHVLDDDLPIWIPIPALAEVQVALEDAVEEVTGLQGYELKRIMRTGTVATIDNRNWELREQAGPVKRLSQSRAVALDMESATIAANGYRFRVPYGTLLCVSDKPLHGELKLPGMASEFYKRQVSQHLQIGIRALEKLSAMPMERLHSRKLRSFSETAFQ
jgi:AMP nucleosidase